MGLKNELTQEDYLHALSKSHESIEEYKKVEDLINKYFSMIDHMKETSLYDVYEYEMKTTEALIEPLRILTIENERLKEEVNDLRRKKGLGKKYK